MSNNSLRGGVPMSLKKRLVFAAVLLSALSLSAFGYDPPQGGYFLNSLNNPWDMALAPSVTGSGTPSSSILNPSSQAANQLFQIETSYTGITDWGVGPQGWGSAASLGFSIPTTYGVWGGNARFMTLPSTMFDMPLGTFGSLRASFAKELSRTLYAGSAVELTMGGNGTFGWGLGADIGITALLGDLGFYKDAKLGIALLNMGKGYLTSTPPAGAFGSAVSSAYPAAFTFGAGIRGSLLQSYYWNIEAAADLWAPAFQDLNFGLSFRLGFRDYAALSAGWSIGLRDMLTGNGRSLLPSIGLVGTIPLGKGLSLFGTKHPDAALGTAVAVQPLYDSLYAASAGFSLSFGVKDKTAPKVSLGLPVPFRGVAYVSPESGSEKEKLTIPLRITDERYIAGWKLTIEDKSSGAVVRTFAASNELAEKLSLSSAGIRKAFGYDRGSVAVPESIIWDGRDDSGKRVEDGVYTMSFIARDDNGNTNLDYQSCLTIVVDSEKPKAMIRPMEQNVMFSPDGDGSRDQLSFRNTGSVENSWTVEISDSAGNVVRTQRFNERSAPRDFAWDGTADDGKRVKDGKYTVILKTKDEAGNSAESSVGEIIVDTSRPDVSIALSDTVMSPNGDGNKDSLIITPKIDSAKNLKKWRVFVLDQDRKEVWAVSGNELAPPAASYVFRGTDVSNAVLSDGMYEAGINLEYQNGYMPERFTPAFLLDRTPPSASIALGDENAIFSPDNDGRRDNFKFSFQSSEEDSWNLIIRDANRNEKVVRQYQQSLPASLVWDGKDDQGRIVPDGDYEVYVFAVDKAGNSFSTVSGKVTVDTARPVVELIQDREAFSPNGDGSADTVVLRPRISSGRGMTSWKFIISNEANASESIRAEGGGYETMPAIFIFDGKDSSGRSLPEGMYKARLSVSYINGFEADVEGKPVLLDVTYPAAEAAVSRKVFNPAGSGEQTMVTIRQSSTAEDLWSASIRDSKGNPVRNWEVSGRLTDIVWDGKGNSGLPVPDGTYTYHVAAKDKAGNAFELKPVEISIDTIKKEAYLRPSMQAFSPNNDGVRDVLVLSPEAVVSERSSGWIIWISPQYQKDARIKTWKGSGALPSKLEWNGMSDAAADVPDGQYIAYLMIEYPNGDRLETSTSAILVDRVPPRAAVKASASLFSPNGDGILDTVTITQESYTQDFWTGTIRTMQGEILRQWTWDTSAASFVWDGTDGSGALLADGQYYYELVSIDKAGNSYTSGQILISIETEKKAVRLEVDQRAFSPNNDGIKDELTLAATAKSPEKVKSWELVIVAQEGELALNAVRTWKGDGLLPVKFIWRGELDAGIAAPEGRYAANLTVKYQNGDVVEASAPTFLLDRIAPKANVSASRTIISPNGDGRSDSVEILQTSEPGDDWTGTIMDAAGRVVRSYTWQNEVKNFSWDGKDQSGLLVRDGIYQYKLESADSAGNKTVTAPISIEVETVQKQVRLDANTTAFSPNDDGVKDTVTFGIQASYPDRITSFKLEVFPAGNRTDQLAVMAWTGTNSIRTQYVWDGRSSSGLKVPDGLYRARLEILYRNDDVFVEEISLIAIDTAAPKATVQASLPVFSPNGDGRSDTVLITQEAVPGDDWQAQIVSAENRIIRSWSWKNTIPSFVWDGKDQSGKIVPDGVYFYELRSIDQAGNSFIAPRLRIEVDASAKQVRLDVDPKAFSPNSDGIKDIAYINIQAPRPAAIREYSISISALDKNGQKNANALRTWSGSKDIKDQYSWDGKTASGIAVPDGLYQVSLRILYENDDLFALDSPSVLVDTVAPKIEVSAEPLLFSPNSDGNKDSITIYQKSVPGDDWTGRIKNASGQVIRTWTFKNEAKTFVWDGKDASGAVVRDGVYSYEVSSSDAAGNSALATAKGITVDAAKPKVYVTASDTGMSPNGDGVRDDVSFTIVVEKREGIESWRFSIIDKQGNERSYFGGTGNEVPSRLVWDGRDLQGQVLQGEFMGKLVVRYTKGDIAEAVSAPITVVTDPPKVDISVTPEYFSPDGDGVDDLLNFNILVDKASNVADWKLEIYENAVVESSTPNAVGSSRLFMNWNGKGKPPVKIVWDGKSTRGELVESATDYPFTFVARDALGNSTTISGVIAVDVLVIRDGDRLKIKVPSIVFRANYSDFIGLPPDIVARNEKVVARIAQILNKFPDYRIRIEGHANNVGKMLGYSQARIQSEEIKELIPLSTGRAELVRTMLIQNGVDARRLSVVGLGSSEPVVSFLDVENRWKNRRVEFVLIKNQ